MAESEIDKLVQAVGNGTVLVAIDPSIKSMGYAVFVNEMLILSGAVIPSAEDKAKPLGYRIQKQMIDLVKSLPSSNYKQLWVVEEPFISLGTAKSAASAASGDVKKLIMIAGALTWHAFLMKADLELVLPGTWKGQLPKFITTERSEKRWQRKFKTDDEADAVSLGSWYIDWRLK